MSFWLFTFALAFQMYDAMYCGKLVSETAVMLNKIKTKFVTFKPIFVAIGYSIMLFTRCIWNVVNGKQSGACDVCLIFIVAQLKSWILLIWPTYRIINEKSDGCGALKQKWSKENMCYAYTLVIVWLQCMPFDCLKSKKSKTATTEVDFPTIKINPNKTNLDTKEAILPSKFTPTTLFRWLTVHFMLFFSKISVHKVTQTFLAFYSFYIGSRHEFMALKLHDYSTNMPHVVKNCQHT